MRRRWRFRDVLWWMLRLTNLSLLFLIAGTAGLLLGTYSGIAEMIPNARELGDIRPGQASRVLSADGELLAQVAYEHREFVQLERIPEDLQEAVIAVEDREFYRHVGVDPRAIFRALVADIMAGRAEQGGSTITQQLARNVYLTPTRTISRKIAEAVLALQLERAYTKPEILELYLNQIYFGAGAYGVQLAAQTYFGRDVEDLDLGECALLAGLPKAPERYSPFNDRQRAVDRRNLVLSLMAEAEYIAPEEAAEIQARELELVEERQPLGLSSFRAPYFTNYVLREVSRRYGADALYKGGLTIHTTLNLEAQQAAEEAAAWGLERAEARRFNADQIALVALDVRTGAIRAMVGGTDYSESQYNRAVQGGRQAGSAFKPFVYTAALEQGYTPDSIVEDTEVVFPGARDRPWRPRNYDGEYHGPVPFREALAHSYNVSAVKVADTVGVGAVIATAERMGIYHEMENYLPLAIGYCDVSPLEMASAYAVFATGGMRTEPYGIQKIEDARGRAIEEHTVQTWRVLHEQVAAQMVDILSTVVRSGTGSVTRYWYKGPAAGKTGTSNEYRDAWFIGFSEGLCAAVWIGNDRFEPTGPGGRGKGISGATIPAPVWAKFMQEGLPALSRSEPTGVRVVEISASEMSAPEAPEPPETPPDSELGAEPQPEEIGDARTVTKRICPTSGLLAGPYCPRAVEVTYDLEAGAQPPTRQCDVHTSPQEAGPVELDELETRESDQATQRTDKVRLPICAITGKIATPRCPVVVIREFDADEAPTESCDRHGGSMPGP